MTSVWPAILTERFSSENSLAGPTVAACLASCVAETVMTATEKTLRAPEFAEIASSELAPGEQQKIESVLGGLKMVLGSTDRETIQKWTHALNDATRHLAEVVMNRSVHAALSGKSVDQM